MMPVIRLRSTFRTVSVAVATLVVLVIVLLLVTKPKKPVNSSLRYSPPETQVDPHLLGVLEKELKTLYDGVETFLLFIGYGRSGHSLIAAILDAHPEILVVNEHNVLGNWENYKARSKGDHNLLKKRLFFDLHSHSRSQALFGNRAGPFCPAGGYCYHVPGQWQGTYKDKIKVMGDKKATITARKLEENFAVLEEMEEVLKMPVKFVHVIRNPFDNIATKLLRVFEARTLAREHNFKVDNSSELDKWITEYFKQVNTVQSLHTQGKYKVLDIYSHELISNPRMNIQKMCNFLEVATDNAYIEASAKIVYSEPSLTRHSVVWTAEQKARVTKEMKNYPFLKPFTFDSN